MKLSFDYRLDAYSARALFENPKEYMDVIHRRMKAQVSDAVRPMITITEIVDPLRPKLPLEELTKSNEYSAFPQHEPSMYPEYYAEVYVLSSERFTQLMGVLRDTAHSADPQSLKINCQELYKLLTS